MKTAVAPPTGKIKYEKVADPAIKKSTNTINKVEPTFNPPSVEDCGSCLFCNNPSHSSCENNLLNH